DPARINIIPCGFDRSEFFPIDKTLARVSLGFRADEKIILNVGRLVPRKGIDNIVRALPRLWEQHGIKAKLLIVGGESDQPDRRATPEIGRLSDVAVREGVEDQVVFAGRRGRDILKYFYSAADIFVTTPWYEPFGMSPVEAMACGTPVIGANVGGVKFSVRDGETGYLVPPNEPAALAQRLAHLYKNPKLLALFRKQAIRRVNDLFTWHNVAEAAAEVYEEVLAAGQPDRCPRAEQLAVVDRCFDRAVLTLQESQRRLRRVVREAAELMGGCFKRGGKVLICGNGGSAAEAQHLAGELVGRFRYPNRPGLPALALTTDGAVLTAWGNDVGFEQVFARQVNAFGRSGDVLVGLSATGRSQNLVKAFQAARECGLTTLALLGGSGDAVRKLADLALIVPSTDAQRIQEVHTLLIHTMCELIEEDLFKERRAQVVYRDEVRPPHRELASVAWPEPTSERRSVEAEGR